MSEQNSVTTHPNTLPSEQVASRNDSGSPSGTNNLTPDSTNIMGASGEQKSTNQEVEMMHYWFMGTSNILLDFQESDGAEPANQGHQATENPGEDIDL